MLVGKFVDKVDKSKDICLYTDEKTNLSWGVDINGGFFCYTKPFKTLEDLTNALRREEIEWMSIGKHVALENAILNEKN